MALPHRPAVVVLDVNETLTDQHALAPAFEQVGAPAHLLQTWFAGTLRDGIALTAAGGYAPFAEVAAGVLSSLLAPYADDLDDAVDIVLGGMPRLPLHPDVAPGVTALRQAGMRVVALTNGAASTARAVLEAGGVAGDLEHVLSIDAVKRWKPDPETYRYAAQTCAVAPEDMLLAAVHPWDVDGAQRAGLHGAWVNRSGGPYPPVMGPPELVAGDLLELAGALSALQ